MKPPLRVLCLALACAAPPAAAISTADIDKSANRCEDFYAYATGNWMANNPIPADQTRWGAFNEIEKRNTETLKNILESLEKIRSARTPVEAQVLAFHQSGMNEAAIERLGLKPLEADLKRIDSIANSADIVTTLAWLQRTRPTSNFRGPQPVGFGYGVRQDAKDSTRYIASFGQGGLGLPERDYYLKTDERSQKLLKDYEAHVARMLALMGGTAGEAQSDAAKIVALETRLARAHMNVVERRDPEKTWNKKTLAEFQNLTPNIDWKAWYATAGLPVPPEMNVSQPAYFAALSTMVKDVPVADWRPYFRFHLVNAWAAFLPKAFVEENFTLRGKLLQGQQVMTPRWKRVMEATDLEIGHSLGQLFVARTYPPEAKAKMDDMIAHIKAAMKDSINGLEWMGPETRQQALRKLDSMVWKIGYPEVWREYPGLKLKPDTYLDNARQAAEINFMYRNDRIGKPVNRKEWGMTPPTVNAYYNAGLNEIVFPAGILQPPFFDAKKDDASNYGGIGMVIGHEITHGFDDNGRKYDADGNLKSWWTKEDEERFLKRVAQIQAQYGAYKPLPDMAINGKLTTGENIADLGGLNIAFNAFKRTAQAKDAKPLDGYTPEQRFFLSYGQIWRSQYRTERLRLQLATDSHSPPRYRVLGPLANFAPFFKSFSCDLDKSFARSEADRIVIW
ncbi:MAG: M13 family metallopeptidase [Betaproteobacteria bacterium]|nr:M13 family metallopeptidase [Betaproteobacteria bacterium]